jgi:hypothetical protein
VTLIESDANAHEIAAKIQKARNDPGFLLDRLMRRAF